MRKPILFYGVIGVMLVVLTVALYFSIPKSSPEEKANLILREELLKIRTEKPSTIREMQQIHDIRFSKKREKLENGEFEEVPIVKLKTDIGEIVHEVSDVDFILELKHIPMLEFTRQTFEDIPYAKLLTNNKIKDNYKKLSGGKNLEDTLKKGSKEAEGFDREFFKLIKNHEQFHMIQVRLPSGMYQELEHYFNPKLIKKNEKQKERDLKKREKEKEKAKKEREKEKEE